MEIISSILVLRAKETDVFTPLWHVEAGFLSIRAVRALPISSCLTQSFQPIYRLNLCDSTRNHEQLLHLQVSDFSFAMKLARKEIWLLDDARGFTCTLAQGCGTEPARHLFMALFALHDWFRSSPKAARSNVHDSRPHYCTSASSRLEWHLLHGRNVHHSHDEWQSLLAWCDSSCSYTPHQQ